MFEQTANKNGKTTLIEEGPDAGTIVTIYNSPVYMKAMSEKEGRPIHQEFPFIIIKSPSQPKSVPDRKLTEADKQRFPQAWDNFLNNADQKIVGLPIETWGEIEPHRAASLKASGILTVETMAVVPDGNLKNLGPDGSQLKKMAKAFLAKRSGDDVKLVKKENESLKAQLAELAAQVKKLSESAADNPAPKKRGRPKKNDAADDSTRRA